MMADSRTVGQGQRALARRNPSSALTRLELASLLPRAKCDFGRLGAVAQFEKATLVAKLKAARDRKRATGWRPGPASNLSPDAIALAKRLHRYPVNGKRRSLRQVSAELAAQGHVTSNGTPYAATAIKRMVSRADPR